MKYASIISVFIIVFTPVFLSASEGTLSADCEELYNRLTAEISSVNTCEKDTDCGMIYLQNRKNSGCGFIGNKYADFDSVNHADKQHYENCIKGTPMDDKVEECTKHNPLACINNKCVRCSIVGKSGKCICPRKDGSSCK